MMGSRGEGPPTDIRVQTLGLIVEVVELLRNDGTGKALAAMGEALAELDRREHDLAERETAVAARENRLRHFLTSIGQEE